MPKHQLETKSVADTHERALRAFITREVFSKRLKTVSALSKERKEDLYYRVYQRLDKTSIAKGQQNFLPPGIDKVVFYNTPLSIQRVGTELKRDITLGELLNRIHLACEEEAPDTLSDILVQK